MKAKLNFKSKRTIIVISIIAVLAIAAGVSAYFFTKGNDTAGATNAGQEEQASNNGVAITENNNGLEKIFSYGKNQNEAIVKSDETLNDNQVVIGIPDVEYNNYSDKEISLIYENKTYTFTIKDIYKSKLS